jgi:4-alpha-glucanotransferase
VTPADPLKSGEAGAAVNGALAFVARSTSPLMVVPVEDLLARTAHPNLPGTVDEHPNWRRRLPVQAGEMLDDPAVAARVTHIRKERA